MRADISDLRLFMAVLDAGSITAGARRAHLSLSAASERLQSLEDDLCVRLFERSASGVRPTDAGRTLATHGRALLMQMERLRSEIAPFAGGLRGRVRLLCNTSALSEYVPKVLGEFLVQHPDIDVEVDESWSPEILQALRDGRADVGVCADSVDTTGLETLPFRDDPLVLLAPRGHRLARRARVGFGETLEALFVGLNADSALHQFLNAQAARSGQVIRYRARVRAFDAVCRMVGQGVGVAIVPRSAARRFAPRTLAAVVELTDAWAQRRLLVCVRSLQELPGYVRELVQALARAQPAPRPRVRKRTR